jgi:hypothetical protein
MRPFKRLRVRGAARVERRFFEIIIESLLQEIALEEEAASILEGSSAGVVRLAEAKACKARR